MNGTKKCSRCKRVLSVSEFTKNKSTKDKLATECRTCCKEVQLEYRERRKNTSAGEGARFCSRCQKVKPATAFLSYYPYCRECQKEIRDKRYQEKERNDPKERERRRVARLKMAYKMTAEEYEQMVTQQNGCCAICGQKPKSRVLHVDHCHKTGRIRKLLCTHCNSILGHAHDDPEVLRKAALYLKEYQAE